MGFNMIQDEENKLFLTSSSEDVMELQVLITSRLETEAACKLEHSWNENYYGNYEKWLQLEHSWKKMVKPIKEKLLVY